MIENQCNENWHVFKGGLPAPGDICNCGQKRATETIHVLEDA